MIIKKLMFLKKNNRHFYTQKTNCIAIYKLGDKCIQMSYGEVYRQIYGRKLVLRRRVS